MTTQGPVLVPPALVLIFVAIMAFESEYVHWLRELFFRTGT
jgi:cytochrome c oxidase subunit IV